jgi:hypothetical protein
MEIFMPPPMAAVGRGPHRRIIAERARPGQSRAAGALAADGVAA